MVSPEIPWVFLGEWNLPELPPTEDRNNHQDVAAAAAAALAARGEAAAGLDAAGESLSVGARLHGDEGRSRWGRRMG